MISSFITCTLMFVSAANTTPATDAKTTRPEVTAPAKPQPKTQTVNRPISEPAKPAPAAPAPAKPAPTTAKFEILAVEQSIVDYTNAERARYGLPALAIDPNLMASAAAWQLDGLVPPNGPLEHGRGGEHRHGPIEFPGGSAHLDELIGPSREYPGRLSTHRRFGLPLGGGYDLLVPAVYAIRAEHRL